MSVLDPETDFSRLSQSNLSASDGYLIDLTGSHWLTTARNVPVALRLIELLRRSNSFLVLITDDQAELVEQALLSIVVRHTSANPTEVFRSHLLFRSSSDPEGLERAQAALGDGLYQRKLGRVAGPREAVALAAMATQELFGQPTADAAPSMGRTMPVPPEPLIARDFWTADDHLGYAPYADAVVSFIRHRGTRPPLTIGIKAPWGAGKTSLMRMLQERLDPPRAREPWAPSKIRLTRRSRHALTDRLSRLYASEEQRKPVRRAATEEGTAKERVTVREVLRQAGRSTKVSEAALAALDVQAPASSQLPQPEEDWRPTVWFNPWMYQSGEQLWAGLAHEIITQISGRMEPGDRERFWLELNLRRVDRQAVRKRIYGVLLERLIPLAFTIEGYSAGRVEVQGDYR